MIFSNKVKVGDKVHYYANRITVNGIIKEVVDRACVRVVFNCDQNWTRFQDYTSDLTSTKSLYYDWK